MTAPRGAPMCIECDDIDATIARYQRLSKRVADPQMREAAAHLIAGLEAEKIALHAMEPIAPQLQT